MLNHKPILLAASRRRERPVSIKDFDYQIKYQRAFEAVLWNMPAMRLYGPTEEINNKTFKLADIELVP